MARTTNGNAHAAKIAIIGDYHPDYPVHRHTEEALGHLPTPLSFEWIPTEQLATGAAEKLEHYDGLLIAPGSPYRSEEGALAAIRFSRENAVPLVGTCGGFQHLVVEFARNVLGILDAGHAETQPHAPRLAVTPLACSLAGQSHPVRFVAGSQVAAMYGTDQAVEPFFCSYGLNPEFRPRLEAQGLVVSGFDLNGEVRILEYPRHPFFIGTLYVPQARSTQENPHPLLRGFAAAASERARVRIQQPAPVPGE